MKKDKASFTVESAYIIPFVILVIGLGIHIAYELQDTNVEEAQKAPLVESINPVEKKYEQWNL
ncbi:MAG: hypothetical protein IJ471_01860 [Eubacterium sp.]|nr:hypothetical protein [Eubacterium sp.]